MVQNAGPTRITFAVVVLTASTFKLGWVNSSVPLYLMTWVSPSPVACMAVIQVHAFPNGSAKTRIFVPSSADTFDPGSR